MAISASGTHSSMTTTNWATDHVFPRRRGHRTSVNYFKSRIKCFRLMRSSLAR